MAPLTPSSITKHVTVNRSELHVLDVCVLSGHPPQLWLAFDCTSFLLKVRS